MGRQYKLYFMYLDNILLYFYNVIESYNFSLEKFFGN